MDEPLKITIDISGDEQFQALLRKTALKAGNMEPAMKIAAYQLRESVMENFLAGGRPNRWKGLADSTKRNKERNGSRPLYLTGALSSSFTMQYTNSEAVVGTKRVSDKGYPYPIVHQLGSKDGRIPARPFMLMQDDDMPQIKAAVLRWLA